VTKTTLKRISGSKGAILDRLRRGPETVAQLARALGVSGPAVRLQLAALEADGLVAPAGLIRTARRPSQEYRLAAAAEPLFCEAYAPFLDLVLHAMRRTLTGEQVDGVLRDAGRRLAGGQAAGPVEARVQAAASVLESLGAATRVDRHGETGTYSIRGQGACPLASIARRHSDACVAVEAMVAEMTGAPAVQHCERDADPPRCVIEVSAPAS
jgi:predicted ArsR family transcriptional regulator